MVSDVVLLLAGSQKSASLAMQTYHLTEDNTAVIENSSYLEQTKVTPNETVYLTSDCSNTMLDQLMKRIKTDLQPTEQLTLLITHI